jgi:hypothetical protein
VLHDAATKLHPVACKSAAGERATTAGITSFGINAKEVDDIDTLKRMLCNIFILPVARALFDHRCLQFSRSFGLFYYRKE